MLVMIQPILPEHAEHTIAEMLPDPAPKGTTWCELAPCHLCKGAVQLGTHCQGQCQIRRFLTSDSAANLLHVCTPVEANDLAA